MNQERDMAEGNSGSGPDRETPSTGGNSGRPGVPEMGLPDIRPIDNKTHHEVSSVTADQTADYLANVARASEKTRLGIPGVSPQPTAETGDVNSEGNVSLREDFNAAGLLKVELARLLNKDSSGNSLRERVEELIRAEEESPEGFSERHVGSLLSAIDEGLSRDTRLQQELSNRVWARYRYGSTSYAAKFIGGEKFAEQLLGIQQEEHLEILNTFGVKDALKEVENPNYFRSKSNEEKNLEFRIRLAHSGVFETLAQRFGKEELDNNFRKNTDIDLNSEESRSLSQSELSHRRELDKFRYMVDRAISLSEKACHIFGISARYDGPVYKEGRVGRAAGPSSVSINFEGKVYDLTSLGANDPVISRIRESQPQLFAQAWDKAWREFFRDHWNEIDFQLSFGGSGAIALRREFFFPIMLEKSNNPNRGRAEFLRRFTYVGVQDLLRTTGRGSVEEQMKNWRGDISTWRSWASRVAGADKARKMFAESAPFLLDDANALGIKGLVEINKAFSYMSTEEQREHMSFLVEGVAYFNSHYRQLVYNERNYDSVMMERFLYATKVNNLISDNMMEQLKRRVMGNYFSREARMTFRSLDIGGALIELFKAIAKAAFSTK